MYKHSNVFDYFFEESKSLEKSFLLGARENISFPELYQASLKLAAYLQKNIGTRENIVLISHNNLYFIVAYLGILKSGNTVIPLNPAIEASTLDYIVDQCSCKTAFIGKGIQVNTGAFDKIIDETLLEDIKKQDNSFSDPAHFDIENTAELIFTSGSTGVPKGVEISHKNLMANTSSIIKYLGLTQKDTMLVVLPFYYCYGLSLFHTHLKVGGSIVLNNSFIFLGGILRDLNQYHCTGFAGVPSHYQILLRKSKSFVSTHFPDLRYVTQAGGKLPTIFIQEFRDAFPEISFYVMYGQTEATARLSYLPPAELNRKLGSIGKGIPDVTLKVVDENNNQVQPGNQGEIIAYGDNIMKGYFKDPELTAETIRNGWLYTGDIATVDEDGFIFVVSRKKEIIKVGGKRVSPKEIEEVILMIPEVVDCTIIGVEDPILGESIKATITLNDEGKSKFTVADILNHCHKHLSIHKVPSQIEFESSINMSATGKKIKKTS